MLPRLRIRWGSVRTRKVFWIFAREHWKMSIVKTPRIRMTRPAVWAAGVVRGHAHVRALQRLAPETDRGIELVGRCNEKCVRVLHGQMPSEVGPPVANVKHFAPQISQQVGILNAGGVAELP